jgi:PAS domain S-box-containing protein
MKGDSRKRSKTGRERGVDRMTKLTDCFLGFGADPLENINRLTATCGEILGAACALYNRLEQGMLCSWGQWNVPRGYKSVDAPDGHICYDVIRLAADHVLVVRNLDETAYALTDPNVKAYNLRTYIGKAVKFDGKSLGSLCVVYQSDYVPSNEDEEILGAIAKAIAVEEERKRATEALRASKETLGALIQGSPLAIVTFDSEGVIRMWNPAAERMFGWSAEEVIGKPHPIVPEDKQQEFRALRDVALRGETFTNVEVRRRRKDGTQIDLSISTAPLRDADGAITSIMSIITDITSSKSTEEALRQSEEQLRQAQKMEAVGRLAGGIAHDFNNLLTAVTGYSELLQERISDRDPMWREIEEIRRAGVRAASLTRQLLAFSRRQVLQTKVLDLNGIVTGLETMLRRLIGEDVELVTGLCGDQVRLKADPGQIEQVVMNLVVNAREAMPQGGRLAIGTASVNVGKREADRLGLAKPGDYAMLAVSDTGVGMSEEVKSHLFEPFFTTKAEGTGLGLATVYGIVKQNGGGIRVDSEIGNGTTIEICFPSVDELVEAADGAGAAPAVASGGQETVLVAEDEDMVRELVCEILQRNGYIVLEACSGDEALLISGRHHGPIHLLLTDMVMPLMRGTDLAERLALLRPEMKILYMSGYTDDATFQNGDEGKGTAFIQKPFGPSTLANKVREVLDSGRKELSG